MASNRPMNTTYAPSPQHHSSGIASLPSSSTSVLPGSLESGSKIGALTTSNSLSKFQPKPSADTSQEFRPFRSDHLLRAVHYNVNNWPGSKIYVIEYDLEVDGVIVTQMISYEPDGELQEIGDRHPWYVYFSKIWMAFCGAKLPDGKAEFNKHHVRYRIAHGGNVRVQGTWLPYNFARRYAEKVAWHIRDDLVPIFGHDFPNACLRPTDPGYGRLQLEEDPQSRRPSIRGRVKRAPDDVTGHGAVYQKSSSRKSENNVEIVFPANSLAWFLDKNLNRPIPITISHVNRREDENQKSAFSVPPHQAEGRGIALRDGQISYFFDENGDPMDPDVFAAIANGVDPKSPSSGSTNDSFPTVGPKASRSNRRSLDFNMSVDSSFDTNRAFVPLHPPHPQPQSHDQHFQYPYPSQSVPYNGGQHYSSYNPEHFRYTEPYHQHMPYAPSPYPSRFVQRFQEPSFQTY